MVPRRCLLFLLATTCALPALSAEQNGAGKPAASLTSFGATVEVNVVNVEVYVTDRDGKRVTDLRREDFTVSEDGKPVEVSNFAAVSPGHALASPLPARATAAAQAPTAAAPTAEIPQPGPDPETALSLVVFLDDLHLRPENRTKAVEQIRTFLNRSVRPGDRVMVATHGLGLHLLQPFTEDRAAIDAALKQAEAEAAQGQSSEQARRSAFRAMYALHSISPCSLEIVRPVESYAEETRDEALRTAAALTVVINSLAGVPGHRALLFVSDGISVTPGEELFQVLAELCGGSMELTEHSSGNSDKVPRGGDDSTKYNPQQAALDAQKYTVAKRFEDLAAHASANRVTLYTLQASGLQGFAAGGSDFDPGERRLLSSTVQQVQISNLKGSLTALAADTGGRAMLDANDLGPELARMQEDFETFYSLGYSPAHHGDGRQHKVEVKVKRPGLRVRYRPSYRDKPAMEKVVDRTLTALLHGIGENPLEIGVELGTQTLDTATGTWAVSVRLKIPLYKLAIIHPDEGGSFQGRLRLLVVTRDRKGGTSPVRQVEVPLAIPRKEVLSALGQHYLYTLTLKLQAGEQRVAVAVRDELSTTTSYLSQAVSVGAVQAATGR
ncbi:MAG: VWA domain-containing protein [Thermoanaerobaculia bacterium]